MEDVEYRYSVGQLISRSFARQPTLRRPNQNGPHQRHSSLTCVAAISSRYILDRFPHVDDPPRVTQPADGVDPIIAQLALSHDCPGPQRKVTNLV
jgi:hypothetical protein